MLETTRIWGNRSFQELQGAFARSSQDLIRQSWRIPWPMEWLGATNPEAACRGMWTSSCREFGLLKTLGMCAMRNRNCGHLSRPNRFRRTCITTIVWKPWSHTAYVSSEPCAFEGTHLFKEKSALVADQPSIDPRLGLWDDGDRWLNHEPSISIHVSCHQWIWSMDTDDISSAIQNKHYKL